MKAKALVKALRANGCRILRAGGEHTVYICGCQGEHKFPLPRHREITAGVVGSAIKSLPCLAKGWLQ